MSADLQRVKTLLAETIVLLCKSGLQFKSEFTVEGLLGITIDKSDIFLINLKETIKVSNHLKQPENPVDFSVTPSSHKHTSSSSCNQPHDGKHSHSKISKQAINSSEHGKYAYNADNPQNSSDSPLESNSQDHNLLSYSHLEASGNHGNNPVRRSPPAISHSDVPSTVDQCDRVLDEDDVATEYDENYNNKLNNNSNSNSLNNNYNSHVSDSVNVNVNVIDSFTNLISKFEHTSSRVKEASSSKSPTNELFNKANVLSDNITPCEFNIDTDTTNHHNNSFCSYFNDKNCAYSSTTDETNNQNDIQIAYSSSKTNDKGSHDNNNNNKNNNNNNTNDDDDERDPLDNIDNDEGNNSNGDGSLVKIESYLSDVPVNVKQETDDAPSNCLINDHIMQDSTHKNNNNNNNDINSLNNNNNNNNDGHEDGNFAGSSGNSYCNNNENNGIIDKNSELNDSFGSGGLMDSALLLDVKYPVATLHQNGLDFLNNHDFDSNNNVNIDNNNVSNSSNNNISTNRNNNNNNNSSSNSNSHTSKGNRSNNRGNWSGGGGSSSKLNVRKKFRRSYHLPGLSTSSSLPFRSSFNSPFHLYSNSDLKVRVCFSI